MYVSINSFIYSCHLFSSLHMTKSNVKDVRLKMFENRAINRFCLKWISTPYDHKLMLLPHSTYCSEAVADVDPLWIQVDVIPDIPPFNVLFRAVWPMLIPYEDKLKWLPDSTYSSEGWRMFIPNECKWMLFPHSTYCTEGVAHVNFPRS